MAPIIQECANCGALIDTSDEEPLALIHCATCGAAARVRRKFDQFEILEVLGAGGMGAVYRALDTGLNRPVALKLLRTEHLDKPELIKSFATEAATTASINHPHVVKVYTTGTARGVFYIAMELVDKGSLDDLMSLQGKVGELQVLEVGIHIAEGLNAAYQRGLIHRDVKPGNILFADAHTAKIVDFGLAVLQEHAGQGGGEVWGTPYYVAPEKLEAKPLEDFRSDMYSLGATLFHAVAGRPPFEAETASMVALKHLKSQAVSLQAFAPEVSSATAYVINKTLSKDPDNRYASYEEFIEHLKYAHTELTEASKNPRQKRLVVVSGDAQDEAMSWVTFVMVAVIVGAGVMGFTYRDHLFGKPAKSGPTTPVASATRLAIETEFLAARDQLAAGKYAEAAAALRALDERPEPPPQPLRNWITWHAGLAWLLAGQPEQASADFLKIEGRGIYTPDSTERKIASFFVETARQAGKSSPQPASVAADYDKASFECLALFLFAVQDWDLGAFEDAGALFRQFTSATPPANEPWIAKYKPIAETYLADFNTYRAAAEAATAADTPEKKKQALEGLRTARTQLKQRGKLIERFDKLEGGLETALRVEEEKKTVVEENSSAADAKVLAELKVRLAPYLTGLKFAEAKQLASIVTVTSEKGRAERDALLAYVGGLAKFKATLISDLNSAGYAKPLLKKNGGAIPGGLQRASEAEAENVSRFGSVPVKWPELSTNSILTVAAAFLRPGAPDAADRQWGLGMYLIFIGKQPEGLTLLTQAAQAKPEYQTLLGLHPEAAATP